MKILAVGRGFIGNSLKTLDENVDVVCHTDLEADLSHYDAIVNTSGIVGDRKCRDAPPDDVTLANVTLPSELFKISREIGAKYIQLSTTGMYRPQTCPDLEGFKKPDELSKLTTYNTYVKSKIEADEFLGVQSFILRLPLFENQLAVRVKHWDSVQDTYLSLTSTTHLLSVIRLILEKQPASGVYNISEKVVYLPDFIETLGVNIPIRTEVPETMTSAVPICIKKAEAAGLLSPP